MVTTFYFKGTGLRDVVVAFRWTDLWRRATDFNAPPLRECILCYELRFLMQGDSCAWIIKNFVSALTWQVTGNVSSTNLFHIKAQRKH